MGAPGDKHCAKVGARTEVQAVSCDGGSLALVQNGASFVLPFMVENVPPRVSS